MDDQHCKLVSWYILQCQLVNVVVSVFIQLSDATFERGGIRETSSIIAVSVNKNVYTCEGTDKSVLQYGKVYTHSCRSI